MLAIFRIASDLGTGDFHPQVQNKHRWRQRSVATGFMTVVHSALLHCSEIESCFVLPSDVMFWYICGSFSPDLGERQLFVCAA